MIRREALGFGEDAGQACPYRLRDYRALKDVLVEQDDGVRRGHVLTHRLVFGVDHDVRLRLGKRDDFVEVFGLPARFRAGEDEHRILRQRLDHFPVALAREEEAGRHEDELVHRETEPRAELSLLLGASRQDRVLERHDEEREALAFVLIRCEELEPALAPRRVDDELARNGAHEHQDEAVAKEPVGHPQRDPRHAEDLEGEAVARVVMQRRRQATVMVKLFRLELVQ